MQQKYTEEELEEMQKQIPEWKQGAVIASEQEMEEDSGFFKRMGQNVGSKINETEYAQTFYKSDEYKQIEELRKNA